MENAFSTYNKNPSKLKSSASCKSLSVILFLLLFCFFAGECQAAQFIKVIVKDHTGKKIHTFNYDKTKSLWEWSPQIFVRSNPDELFLLDISKFSGKSSWHPHDYEKVLPRKYIEVFKGDQPVTSGFLDEKDTFPVDRAGIYTVRCSTTFQVNGETIEEHTSTPYEGTIVPPTFREGVDEKGRYEFYRIETFNFAGRLAYRYYKRYTYNVVVSTVTHVSPGEKDRALIVIPKDPEALGNLAGATGEAPIAAAASDYLTNLIVKQSISAVTNQIVKRAFGKGIGQSLLASGAATLIYIAASPEEDFNIGVLIKAGLEHAAAHIICLKLGIAAGTQPYVAVAIAASVAVDILWKAVKLKFLSDDFKKSIIDDMIIYTEKQGDKYKVAILNCGATLYDVQLATQYQNLYSPVLGFGKVDVLPTGGTCTFENIPETWFGENRKGNQITTGVPHPAIMFSGNMLGRSKKVQVAELIDQFKSSDREFTAAAANSPECGVSPESLSKKGRSILFILDASGSMDNRSRGGRRRKIDVAKLSLLSVLEKTKGYPNMEWGLIAFQNCGQTRITVPFTTDPREIENALKRIRPMGKTPLEEAISKGTEYCLARSKYDEIDIVLLTDGYETCGGNPEKAANRIRLMGGGTVK